MSSNVVPRPHADDADPFPPTVVIACGALVRELRAVLPDWPLDVRYLPAPLHNRPEQITPAIAHEIATTDPAARIVIGYADCGTGGALDRLIEQLRSEGRQIDRLAGEHCYGFFTGNDTFDHLHSSELGTFFLTDYLARHFDQLIWSTYRLGEHPELVDMMFGHYTKLVYLAQTDDPDTFAFLCEAAEDAAGRLGLEFSTTRTGLRPFATQVGTLVSLSPERPHPHPHPTEE